MPTPGTVENPKNRMALTRCWPLKSSDQILKFNTINF